MLYMYFPFCVFFIRGNKVSGIWREEYNGPFFSVSPSPSCYNLTAPAFETVRVIDRGHWIYLLEKTKKYEVKNKQ